MEEKLLSNVPEEVHPRDYIGSSLVHPSIDWAPYVYLGSSIDPNTDQRIRDPNRRSRR